MVCEQKALIQAFRSWLMPSSLRLSGTGFHFTIMIDYDQS